MRSLAGKFTLTLTLGPTCLAVATGVALVWTEAPTSGAPWTARGGNAAVILANGTVLSIAGWDGSSAMVPDVFRITPGSTALQLVTAAAGWSARHHLCAVTLLGTDEIVVMGGFGGTGGFGGFQNDAWHSTDGGATFVQISNSVWAAPQGREFPGCVAISATKLVAFGGEKGGTRYNDVRISTDAGVSWTDVDHASCGANPPIWVGRTFFGYTYMALLGRIVIAGGQDSSYVDHNDIWFSQSDGKCWTLAKADVNIGVDGYKGPMLLTVPFGGVEALLLVGGKAAGVYLSTSAIQLSLNGGFNWTVIASAAGGSAWAGRFLFTAIVDPVSSRLLVWGGSTASGKTADLWSTPLQPVFAAMMAQLITAAPTAAPTSSLSPTSAPTVSNATFCNEGYTGGYCDTCAGRFHRVHGICARCTYTTLWDAFALPIAVNVGGIALALPSLMALKFAFVYASTKSDVDDHRSMAELVKEVFFQTMKVSCSEEFWTFILAYLLFFTYDVVCSERREIFIPHFLPLFFFFSLSQSVRHRPRLVLSARCKRQLRGERRRPPCARSGERLLRRLSLRSTARSS